MNDSSDGVMVIRGAAGKAEYAVLPWAVYQRLRAGQGVAMTGAEFRRALANRPVSRDRFDLALAEDGAREAKGRRPSLARHGRAIETFTPQSVIAAQIAGATPLKAWREHRGVTQARLADQAKISRAYLAQIESGARVGTIKLLQRLADALGVLVDDLANSTR